MAPEWNDRKGMDFGKYAKPCPSKTYALSTRAKPDPERPWQEPPLERVRVFIGRRQVATC